MTATIHVQADSPYAHLNGQSFPVVNVVIGTSITVLIDGANVDFRWTEAKIWG